MNNIIKRVWNQNRMVNIEDLRGMAFQAEDGGHTFEISGINDANEAVSLSGTVAGVFMRPDGTDVALTGTASDGVVSVILSDACYAVAGRFWLTIFVTADSKKTCVYACIGTVAQTSYGAVAGDTPQDVVDLINAINAAIASIPADYTDLMAAVAPTYSNTALYSVGSYVWYDGDLYRCNTAITTAESWTAAHWTAAVLGDDVADLKSSITTIESVLNNGDNLTIIPFFTNANHYRIAAKLDRLVGGGTLSCSASPTGTKYAVQGWTTAGYAIRSYDSGWKTEPFTIVTDKNLFYRIEFAKSDWGTFSSLDDVGGFTVYYETSLELQMSQPRISSTVKSIAHRGDCINGPQNTAPAYILAKNHGHTIGENDVWNSLDNEFVMWHDTTLGICGDMVDINGYEIYTDGNGFYYYDAENATLYTYTTEYVQSAVDVSTLTRANGANYSVTGLTLDVLKRIDVGVYKGEKFAGTQILTFDEWILLMKQIGMDAYIDRKIGYTTTIATQLANIVKKYGMLDHVSWIGVPNAALIEAIRAVDPNARIGILDHPNSTNVVTYANYNTGRGFFFDGSAQSGLTEASVQLGINAGYEVECYCVDYKYMTIDAAFALIKDAISYGCSGITLDHYRVDEVYKELFDKYQ